MAAPHPGSSRPLVTQVVPSPFGLKGNEVVKELLAGGFIGELREVQLLPTRTPPWPAPCPAVVAARTLALSGFNMLTLGILHETLLRWVPPSSNAFWPRSCFHIPARIESAEWRPSGRASRFAPPTACRSWPSLATALPGPRTYFSGVTPHGQSMDIRPVRQRRHTAPLRPC